MNSSNEKKSKKRFSIQNYWLNHLLNFLAVILGVYLAFSINESANLSQEKNESIIFLKSIKNDLSYDIDIYEKYEIPENIQHQKQVENLLRLMMADSLEAFERQIPCIIQVENYTPTTSTYSSMKSSGKLSLIQDLDLQKKLSDFYEGLVFETQKKGEYQVDYFTREILTWLINNFDLMEMKIINDDKLILFRNKLIIYESLIDQKVKTYEQVVDDSKLLKGQIENIINQ